MDDEDGLGYEEDTGLSNVKLVVGFAGVGASLFSHVYPAPFPKNWWVLLFCVGFYFAMSSVLQFFLSFMEIESILLLRGKKGADGRRGCGLNLHSHFPRFQEMYTLGVTKLPRGSLGLYWAPKFWPVEEGEQDVSGPEQKTWSIAEFFDEEGGFQEEAFEEEVKAFLQNYEAKCM